jgi:acyl-CoA synthetase (AMP-forming)/AMP-acid ligase II
MRHSATARSFKDVLRHRAAERPDEHVFGLWGEGKVDTWLSYAQLDSQARAIAARLQAASATGARVLLLYPPGLDYVAAFYGCLYAGVIAVPAYPPDPSRLDRTLPRLRAIVTDAQATIVLTTRALLDMFGALGEHAPDLTRLTWIASDDATPADDWTDHDGHPDDVAFLQYTSGSTGSPKGVKVTHRNLFANSEVIRDVSGYSRDTRMVTWLPPYHDMGLIGSILQPVYTGFSCVHMSPTQFLFKPLRWLEAISATRATTSGAPNFAFELCVAKVRPEQKQALDLSSWEHAYCSAEPVRVDTLERFARAFEGCGFQSRAYYPCYGLAEGTLVVTGVDKGAGYTAHASPATSGKPVVSMGRLVTGGELLIVDPARLAALPDGQVGEIWVQSDCIAAGYWNRPEDTQAIFGAHLGDGRGPFLRTGDLGFVVHGELFVTGRMKELILVRGRKHFPSDIETTIEAAQWSSVHHRAGGTAAFSLEVDGEERLYVAIEIERRQSERRRGSGVEIERRRGADRRSRPFNYRREPQGGDVGPDPDVIVRMVRTAITSQHGVEPYGVFLLRPGSIPKTSSGKKQRVLCRHQLLRTDAHANVLHAWFAAAPRASALQDGRLS